MFIQTIQSLHPLQFLLFGLDPAALLSGLDFVEIIF